ncbi:extracellular solute-binding protein [Acidobacteria bacterium AH-259-G07]|nr:extracellular solute-binding protein [Acidobacteria bacterium AH-259-G07]
MNNRNVMARREFLLLSGWPASAVVLSFCGPSTMAPESTSSERTLNYLGWEGYDAIDPDAFKHMARWMEEQGLTLRSTYIGNNEEMFTKIKTAGPGAYDLATLYVGVLPAWIDANVLEPIDIGQLSNFPDLFENFRQLDSTIRDGVHYAVPFTWSPSFQLYSADRFPEPPKSWMDLLDKKYEGRVATVDGHDGFFTTMALILGYGDPSPRHLTRRQFAEVKELGKRFMAQIRTVAPSYGDLKNLLVSGEADITMAEWAAVARWSQAEGANIQMNIPEEGSHTYVEGYVIPRNPPNKVAAMACHKAAGAGRTGHIRITGCCEQESNRSPGRRCQDLARLLECGGSARKGTCLSPDSSRERCLRHLCGLACSLGGAEARRISANGRLSRKDRRRNQKIRRGHSRSRLYLGCREREFISLLGPSGCGKTTLLRIIAGLETSDQGSIVIDGENMAGLMPEKRPVNMVFQRYALFPHINVFNNIAFSQLLRKKPQQEIEARVSEMLALVNLDGYENRRVSELSGGQSQRVALARSLINQPKVLLLDEPLGALDLLIRRQMQFELKRIQKRLETTFLYVTQDQEEAMVLSDRIVLMNNGRIVQVGKPEDLYKLPKAVFAAPERQISWKATSRT